MKNKKEYYKQLSLNSKTLEITSWLKYFMSILIQAQKESWTTIEFIIQKAKFWEKYKEKLTEREELVIKRMFKEGPGGFKGGGSSKKYSKLTSISKATATRDLASLVKMGGFKSITS